MWNTIVQNISGLRIETFNHIGFEAKQEMKPYYNIVLKAFQVAILKKVETVFSNMESPMWVIIQNTNCSDIHVVEN